METALERLQDQIQHDGPHALVVNVARADVLDGALRAFSRSTFDCRRPLNVRFSGEAGIDEGGPAREFMRLALHGISESSIFTGPENARNLTLDSKGTLM